MCVCMDVNQGGTNRNRCIQTCNLACTDPLMNPDSTPKTRSVWSVLWVKVARRKKLAWISIFKPAEPHSAWDACFGFWATRWATNVTFNGSVDAEWHKDVPLVVLSKSITHTLQAPNFEFTITKAVFTQNTHRSLRRPSWIENNPYIFKWLYLL